MIVQVPKNRSPIGSENKLYPLLLIKKGIISDAYLEERSEKWYESFRKNNPRRGPAMPYDQETRDPLQAYYETHDFTGSIPAFDDKKHTPAQLQI